ncbi:MAG: alpha/beta hydrolase [Desulfobulbus propionicus]|nr:MAG: alpha/beta hydrolase [Desulfobulbus propionicus]
MDTPFTPPFLLRNPHVQTVFASLAPRKKLAKQRAKHLLAASRDIILQCGNRVRLLGAYSARPKNDKGLVILIHGWEGSSNSAYLLSAAGYLYNQGCNIFRLNLRDHGESYHLNRDFFNSNRLDEVVGAVAEILRLFPHKQAFLAGFSLGGNFALRVGFKACEAQLRLTKIAAISPLIDPVATTNILEQRYPVYQHYFIKKWKRSLQKKIELFPDLENKAILHGLRSLAAMHDYFVPRHTDHPTTHAYLSSYKITQEQLNTLRIPTHIIASSDDPITPWQKDFFSVPRTPWLTVDELRYGGHCGFLQSYTLTSWADQRLAQFFATPST